MEGRRRAPWKWAGLAAVACLAPGAVHAQGQGLLVGRVTDARTGEPLANAHVHLGLPSDGWGASLGTLTSAGGRYAIGVPPGVHDVTVQLIGYGTRSVGVELGAGQTMTLDFALEEQAIELEAITVTSSVQRSSATALMAERRRSLIAVDAIGAEQISRSPDGDAAQVLKRVPGVTVVDGKYAYVRGLGERYSATTLNGAPLASPEPDRKVVPLDLFPAGMLESVVTSKTYSPDQPGDFAGGLVQLRTPRFPSQRILEVGVTAGWNSVTSLRQGLGYTGGGLDFLGVDDGTRGLPSAIPRDARVSRARFSSAELQAMGRAFRGDWAPSPRELPPNTGLSLSFGEGFELGSQRRLGVVASARHSSEYGTRADVVERVFSATGSADPVADYTGEVTGRTVTTGGMLGLTYQRAEAHQLELATVYTRTTDDVSRVLSGFNLDANANLWTSRIQYLEQVLLNTQLTGEHVLRSFRDATLRWRAAYSRASRYEPSTRESLYREFDGTYLWDDFIQSGSVFHQDSRDEGFDGGLSMVLPFELGGREAALSVGGSFERRERAAYTRRFRFRPEPGGMVDDQARALDPNELFGPPGTYIGPGGFELEEVTFRTDNYDAEQGVDALYALLEIRPVERLRLSGGVRVERSLQTVDPKDLWATGLPPVDGARLASTDVLPAVNVAFSLTERATLRASASRTLARPQLRELAPFSFADYVGGYLVLGNPGLEGTRISNLDLRFEWFRAPRSVLAVSTFYKRFESPIEVAVLPSTELIETWVNGGGGESYGVELEATSDLEIVARALADLTLSGNLTLVRSRIETGGVFDAYLPGSGVTKLAATPRGRRLQGQSPYVVNTSLTWSPPGRGASATLLFHRFGERIDAVSPDGLPDVVEQARSQLDAAVAWPLGGGWKAELSATRLLGNVVQLTQGDGLVRSYDVGRSLSLGLSWGAGR